MRLGEEGRAGTSREKAGGFRGTAGESAGKERKMARSGGEGINVGRGE